MNLMLSITIATLLFLVWNKTPLAKDDTDPPNGRSGLSLYTDNKTGLQYIGTMFGSLTPRLDSDGKQMKAH